MYKVGDVARVKKDLKYDEVYGGLGFILSMEKYSGKNVTITDILYGGYYSIDLDHGDCKWTNEMLEDIYIVEVESTSDKSELDKYKELTSLLLGEIKLIDRTRYEDVKHFITELRADLSELVG
ncbi:hypothetical protein [Clostridium sp.]|uniref:hypothetical protein n=1 Tax=Clostridium sp. TaxID=1506 RepID=UPI001A429445|nr:hypothetical protein [Clostridium sp.]MBK5242157.1 hypothetical protein [Clostridium sp.]